jgi:tetratricopeptide (TPR) repeat protein
VLVLAVLAAFELGAQFTPSQPDLLPADYPGSLQRDLDGLLAAGARESSDVTLLLRLADVYLNLADDLLIDPGQRRAAYDESARGAARALSIDDRSAEAHFLYAVAVGSAARMRTAGSAALVVSDVKRHVARALEIRPEYPEALQMMGGLLAELPWFLGGDIQRAQEHLERAIALDGNFTHARILLAKLYIRQGRVAPARAQLRAVIAAARPHYPYTWARRFRPEAERLLRMLE